MSEQLAFIRKKGGGGRYTETSLWTNSAPTSSFGAQTVTLSDNMSNYKYLKIRYAFSTSAQADANCNEIEIPVTEFRKSLASANLNALISIGGTSSTTRYSRFVFYPSDTGVQFGSAVQFSSSTINNNTCIPLEILGLNELDHGHRMNETILWTNASPTSNFSAQSITLSDDIDNYDFIGVRYYYNTTYNTGDCVSEFLARVSDVKKWTYNTNTRHNAGSFAIQDNGNTVYERTIMYESDTQLRFGSAIQVPGTTQSNGTCLPINIIGYKLS